VAIAAHDEVAAGLIESPSESAAAAAKTPRGRGAAAVLIESIIRNVKSP
jgi:hypothetical protein